MFINKTNVIVMKKELIFCTHIDKGAPYFKSHEH